MLVWVALNLLAWSGKIRCFCGDETRLELKTIGGREITAKGVKHNSTLLNSSGIGGLTSAGIGA